MTPLSERLVGPAPDLDWLTHAAAEAYAAAAMGNAPMRELVNLIEPLRETAAAVEDPYLLGRSFDAAVPRSVGSQHQSAMTSLRDGFYGLLAIEIRSECRRAFADDLDKGRRVWLRRYGQAMAEGRPRVCQALTAPGWLPEAVEDWRSELSQAARRMRRAEWHVAVPTVERLLEEDPPPQEQMPLLAMASRVALAWLEDSTAAERYVRRALAISPDAPPVVAARAYLRMWQGDRKEADQLLADSLHAQAAEGITQAYCVMSALWWDSPEVVEVRALEALRQAPYEVALYQLLMLAYATPDLFKEREAQLRHLAVQRTALDPDEAYDTQIDLGVAFRDNGEHERALDLLQGAVEMDPTRARAFGEIARLRSKEKRFGEAAAELDRALAIDPHTWDTMQIAVEISDQQSEISEADGWLRRAAETGVGNSGYRWATLAGRQFSAGQVATAWETAERAIVAAPEVRTCLELTGLAASRWRTDPDSVRRLFLSVVSDHAGDRATLQSLLGDAAYAAEDYESAATSYAAAAEASPDRGWYRRDQAAALREVGRWPEAEDCILAAFEVDSDVAARDDALATLHNAHANRLYEAGEYAEAEPLYRAGVRLSPQDAVFWSNLSLALEESVKGAPRVGRLREAVDALVKAAELAGDDGEYGVRLARLRTDLGRLDRFGQLIEVPAGLPPVIVDLADDLVPIVDPNQNGRRFFDERLPAMRRHLAARLGFEVPGVRFRPAALSPGAFRVQFLGVTHAGGRATSPDPLEASSQMLVSLEDAIAAHASLLFGVDTATQWWRDHGGDETSHTRPPMGRSSRDEHRRATTRLLAAIRALRACVTDGIALDQHVADLVTASLDEQIGGTSGIELNHMALAATAVASVRFALRGAGQPALPAWAVKIAADRPLTGEEEQRLLLEVTGHRATPGEVPEEAPQPIDSYLRRLAEEADR